MYVHQFNFIRGNSKYHYYGIQIKSSSKLNNCDYKLNESENYDDASKRSVNIFLHGLIIFICHFKILSFNVQCLECKVDSFCKKKNYLFND